MRKPIDKRKIKWVDDLTCLASLHLASSLVVDSRPDVPRPVPYTGRYGLRQHTAGRIGFNQKSKIKVNHQKATSYAFCQAQNI